MLQLTISASFSLQHLQVTRTARHPQLFLNSAHCIGLTRYITLQREYGRSICCVWIHPRLKMYWQTPHDWGSCPDRVVYLYLGPSVYEAWYGSGLSLRGVTYPAHGDGPHPAAAVRYLHSPLLWRTIPIIISRIISRVDIAQIRGHCILDVVALSQTTGTGSQPAHPSKFKCWFCV